MMIETTAAIAACGARVLAANALPSHLSFSTDSRTLLPGQAFVALRGAQVDGGAFVAEALERGAAAFVVSDAARVPAGAGALVVADTTAAYLAFGGVARRALHARVAAITGSTGKTTTKTFLAQLLERASPLSGVLATPANENNEIGVAKLLLGATADSAFLVVEFGARHFGEIEPLARAAQPDVAVLTNLGDAHLEIMGSRERLVTTKWGIFATGAQAVLNADDAASRERAVMLERPPIWFAARTNGRATPNPTGDRFVSLARVRAQAPRDVLTVAGGGAPPLDFDLDVTVPGEHNRANTVAAAAAALALGIAPDAVAAALPKLALPQGRYERLAVGGIDLIYDAYNASMSGTLATLSSFAREPGTRRIAVLGSMAELGADAPAMHASVGAAAARANLDALLVGGEFAPDLQRGAREGGFDPTRIVAFATNAIAVAWLRANVRSGDLVLLKGSRRYKLEEIVEGLRA